MYFSTFYRSIKLDKKIMVENLVTSPKKKHLYPKVYNRKLGWLPIWPC